MKNASLHKHLCPFALCECVTATLQVARLGWLVCVAIVTAFYIIIPQKNNVPLDMITNLKGIVREKLRRWLVTFSYLRLARGRRAVIHLTCVRGYPVTVLCIVRAPCVCQWLIYLASHCLHVSLLLCWSQVKVHLCVLVKWAWSFLRVQCIMGNRLSIHTQMYFRAFSLVSVRTSGSHRLMQWFHFKRVIFYFWKVQSWVSWGGAALCVKAIHSYT